jgi:ABC-type transporter Mla subunit MlaD
MRTIRFTDHHHNGQLEDNGVVTLEQRVEQIDRNVTVMYEVLGRTQDTLTQFIRSMDTFVVSTNTRFTRLENALEKTNEALSHTNEVLAQFQQSSDARMRRIEENLEALIRAITSEHTNGKGSH